jgi:hypothetical protein
MALMRFNPESTKTRETMNARKIVSTKASSREGRGGKLLMFPVSSSLLNATNKEGRRARKLNCTAISHVGGSFLPAL